MGILGAQGFETQDLTDDGVVVVAGSPLYSTTVPPGSGSARSLSIAADTVETPWISGVQTGGTRNEPSGTQYWFHGYFRTNANAVGNKNNRLGTSRNGVESIVISFEDSTNRPTIRVAGFVRATAASFSISLNTFTRFHIHVTQTDGGTVLVYAGGNLADPVVSYTLTATDITNLNGKANAFFAVGYFLQVINVDDLWAMDPLDGVVPTNIQDLANATVEPNQFTGNGNYTQWTGTFADIDALPFNGGTDISVSSVDQASTFTHGGTSQNMVHWCQTKWRVTRGDASAGVNMQIRIREGGSDKDETITAAPGSGNVIQHHATARDGTAWDATKFNGTEFGPVSRT